MDEFFVMAQEKSFRVYSFQEEYGLKPLFDTKVVEDWSSCLNNPVLETKQFISSNHMDMCRFSGPKDPEYTKVAAALTHMLGIIESRVGTAKHRQSASRSQSPGTDREPSIPEPQGVRNDKDNRRIPTGTRQSIIEKLYFTEIDERLTNLTAAQRGTCRWFLTKPEYTSWRDPTQQSGYGGFLWIWGHPGTGKSTLMKLLFEEVKRDAKRNPRGGASPITLSFFFLARGTLEEKSTVGLYRSLLHQLFEEEADLQDSLEEALTADGARNIQANGWHEEALKQTFSHAIRKLGDRSLTIFVDALDECDDHQARDMVGFFEDLCELAQDNQVQLRICLSSRHYPHIETKGRNIILENEAGHKKDIEQYIKKKLRLPTSKDAQSLRLDLLEASRMIFLWVVLVVDILNKDYPSKSIKQMGRRLREIPKELGDLFEMILQRDGENPEVLQICLKWILFAERPMKLQELYFAVQFGLGEEGCSGAWDQDDVDLDAMKITVKEWSKGLSETKGKAFVVQFIHESVRDFLLGRYKYRWDEASENVEGRGHEILRDSCLAQVEAAIDQNVHAPRTPAGTKAEADQYREIMRSRFPFLEYSILKILHHANSAQHCGLDQGDFLGQFPLDYWKALNNVFEEVKIRRYGEEVNLLYLLAQKNLANLIKFCPPKGSCFYLEEGIHPSPRYGPPLFAALATGSTEAVRVLLEAEVQGQPSDSRLRGLLNQSLEEKRHLGNFSTRFRFLEFGGPLFHIAKEGDATLLEILFDSPFTDIHANSPDPWSGRAPLSYAAGRGHIDMVTLLLEKGADISHRNIHGQTPLSHAVGGGHPDMITLLLKEGADIEQGDKNDRAPLSHAAEKGHLDMVTLLLKEGADANQRDRHGRTPILYAAEKGQLGMVALLLKEGADANQRDRLGRTPISYAAEKGQLGIVTLLSEAGADIEQGDVDGRSPISYAAEKGRLDTVTLLLLRSGLHFDLKDKSGCTPLTRAARWNHTSVVEALLQSGADADSRDRDGRTPLSWAAGLNNQVIVKVLCASGALVDTKDRQGRTPLSWAAGSGDEATVKILCGSGALVDTKDEQGRTPLSWAAGAGKETIVRILYGSGARIDAKDDQGNTPLSWAALSLSRRVGEVTLGVLCARGAYVDSKDGQGRTPLSWAVSKKHLPAVKLLLSMDADITLEDDRGRTPLWYAAQNSDDEMMELLRVA
ncbi:ankyrin repeat-containing domain protein [Chaetomium fimeti]|uniref:Ankyrin repeat-containing domain protein n=1 Tax=Chaetomium fimeti TaxID=1854472 RepID=A0AAE0HL63_9PEZI|nr:ankyrin repeat-containing domain protein [Chaetomium fimeti]